VDAVYLTNLVRFTGVAVALVASFLAAPDATRHLLWAPFRRGAVATGHAVSGQIQQAWDRLRGHGRFRGSTVQGSAHAAFGAFATATGTIVLPVDADAPLQERVGRLEQHIATLKSLHEQNKQAIAKEATDRQEAVRRVTERIEREAAAIRGEIGQMQRAAQVVDARAVPVVGIGIVLTSIPDVIAQSPVASGLVIAGALIWLQWAWEHFWASGPAGY
jgi:hypothetical protein